MDGGYYFNVVNMCTMFLYGSFTYQTKPVLQFVSSEGYTVVCPSRHAVGKMVAAAIDADPHQKDINVLSKII